MGTLPSGHKAELAMMSYNPKHLPFEGFEDVVKELKRKLL
jgi:hypothetical protein